MTLLELCEPLFQYVCKINRAARAGAAPSPAQVRADVKSILSEMRAKAAQTPGMLSQFEIKDRTGIELVLICYVDYMIRSSRLPWATSWENLAEEHNVFAGDDHFFVLLDNTLEDRSPEAAERLTVFYTCLGLGFEGAHEGQPQELQRYLNECAARIRHLMDASDADRICKEAYEYTDTRVLDLPPTEKILNRIMVFLALLVFVYVLSAVAYNAAVSELNTALATVRDSINNHATGGAH